MLRIQAFIRGSRQGTPLARLRPLGDHQSPPFNLAKALHRRRPEPTSVATTEAAPLPLPIPPIQTASVNADVLDLLLAEGDMPRQSLAGSASESSAVDNAIGVLADSTSLARRQKDDAHLGQVCQRLCTTKNVGGSEWTVDVSSYSVGEDESRSSGYSAIDGARCSCNDSHSVRTLSQVLEPPCVRCGLVPIGRP